METKLQQLRAFFKISNAAFEFSHTVRNAFGMKPLPASSMHQLHRIALIELEKEEPNLQYVDMLLAQMEQLAEKNAAK